MEMLASRYLLIKKLGSGGMSDVYLAIDKVLNREVSIKILRGELANDPISIARFQREANAAARLSHPNIVEVYDVGEENNNHYIVMEYVRGKTLKQLIYNRGSCCKEEAVDIMKQLVSAIKYSHEHNVIHRDIKPQNVLVKDDGTVKMVDFGIALAQNSAQLTHGDKIMGSVHYLAPEVAKGEQATNQSDIYALGIVFYELLRGEVPFDAEGPVQVALKHMKEEFPSIREFNPNVPQSIENIIFKCTAKNLKNRYHDAGSLLEDINNCLLDGIKDQERVVFDEVSDENAETIVVLKDEIKKDSKKKDNGKMIERLIGGLIIGISLIIMLSLGILLYWPSFKEKAQVNIPFVSGMTIEEATTTLKLKGFNVLTTPVFEMTDDIEEGIVIGVVQQEGKLVNEGSTVQLIVSDGKWFVVEDYVGKNIDEVKKLLADTSINIRITFVPDNSVAKGTILSQSGIAPNTNINPKKYNEIKFNVATENEIEVPNFVGLTIEQAKTLVQREGINNVDFVVLDKTNLTEEQLQQIVPNTIVSQTPAANEIMKIEEGKYITLGYYE